MAYQLISRAGRVLDSAPTVADFNNYLPQPLPLPTNGDWQAMAEAIEGELARHGMYVHEVKRRVA